MTRPITQSVPNRGCLAASRSPDGPKVTVRHVIRARRRVRARTRGGFFCQVSFADKFFVSRCLGGHMTWFFVACHLTGFFAQVHGNNGFIASRDGQFRRVTRVTARDETPFTKRTVRSVCVHIVSAKLRDRPVHPPAPARAPARGHVTCRVGALSEDRTRPVPSGGRVGVASGPGRHGRGGGVRGVSLARGASGVFSVGYVARSILGHPRATGGNL